MPKEYKWIPVQDCPHCGQPMIPTAEELEAAEVRCSQLDNLSEFCGFGKFSFQLTHDERIARERWDQIMAEQTEFENNELLDENVTFVASIKQPDDKSAIDQATIIIENGELQGDVFHLHRLGTNPKRVKIAEFETEEL